MTRELISRMSWEPEIFTISAGLFIAVGGKTVHVRTYGEWRWSLVVRGGEFGMEGRRGDVISYERLSWWQSYQVHRASRAFRVAA